MACHRSYNIPTHGRSYLGSAPRIANYGPSASQTEQRPDLNQYYPQTVSPMIVSAAHANHWQSQSQSASHYASPGPSNYAIPSPPLNRTQQDPPRTKQIDWGTLAPGQVHQVSVDIAPTPQAIMDGTFQQGAASMKKDIVIYAPRRAEFSGPPSIPSILFSVNGKPGPYIRDIAKRKVVVDGAYDQILRARVWKQTWYKIEWPGTENNKEAINCFGEKDEPITRAELAVLISTRLCQFFIAAKNGKLQWGPQRLDRVSKDWNLAEIDYRDVRLMGMNYYRNTWIPVLAMDVEYD